MPGLMRPRRVRVVVLVLQLLLNFALFLGRFPGVRRIAVTLLVHARPPLASAKCFQCGSPQQPGSKPEPSYQLGSGWVRS